MTYFLIFIVSFLFGIWMKVSGGVISIESENYIITINSCFIIIACVIALFIMITLLKIFSHITSIITRIHNKKKNKEELLIFENLLSMDLDYHQGNLDYKLPIVKIFNMGKSGNYSFFSYSLNQLAKESRNLSLLISYKLINYLRKDRIVFENFIGYCSTSINGKLLSLPFRIEYAILKEDWYNAIVNLKEAIRSNILLPFNHKEMFAIFYCALAKEYASKDNFKEAIKFVYNAQNYCPIFQPINYLKAELYIKLGKIKKASAILETEYAVNPTPQIARLYFDLNNQNAEKLYNLRQDYYFSHCMLALSAINSGKYDLADQHLSTAMTKANYLSIYLLMIQLKAILQNSELVTYWLSKLYSQALPDPGWKCKNCYKEAKQWDCKCFFCGDFNCITII